MGVDACCADLKARSGTVGMSKAAVCLAVLSAKIQPLQFLRASFLCVTSVCRLAPFFAVWRLSFCYSDVYVPMLRALLGKLETSFLAVKLLEAMFFFFLCHKISWVCDICCFCLVCAIDYHACKKSFVASHHQSGESSHLWLVSVGDDVNWLCWFPLMSISYQVVQGFVWFGALQVAVL